MTWPCLGCLYLCTTPSKNLVLNSKSMLLEHTICVCFFSNTVASSQSALQSPPYPPLSIAGRASPSSITLLIFPRPQPPSVTCTLFLHCRFSLHSPISLPDSWRPLCCISHTESNAITVSARGAGVPRWRSGTQQRPPSSRRDWRRQQPVRYSFSATPHQGFLSSLRAMGGKQRGR